MPSGHRVCIVTPFRRAYSETFIQAHIERLPAEIQVLHGGFFPFLRNDDQKLIHLYKLRRLIDKSISFVVRNEANVFRDAPLKYFLKKNNIDIVLAEYGPTGSEIALACDRAGIPLVVHFHGFDAYRQDVLHIYGSKYPRLSEKSAAVIAVSQEMKFQLINIGFSEHKIRYNPYGVDTMQFRGASPDKAPPLFVAVGRFVEKKGPLFTLAAFKKTLINYPNAHLIMIGDGPLLEPSRRLCTELRIDNAVEFRGAIAHQQVAKTLRASRAFVQHSITSANGDSEGTPVAILEAGAAGLPVISTRHGGIPDVVINGKTGFLVDEGDVDGMARHMIEITKNPSLAGHLGREGRKHITREFSIDKRIKRLWSIMQEAMGLDSRKW